MRESIYASVEDVPGPLWDSIAPADFFFRRDFLEVMERSEVENARYRYVLLFSDDVPIGMAVLSAFTLKLDLLTGDPWILRLRRWLPRLLDVPMICCGIPASFGQHHVHVTRPELVGAALERVDSCMAVWAEETRSDMLVWKEWSPAQGVRDHARAAGYLVFPTLPDHVVRPLPAGVEDFVGSLRSTYRRKYRTAVALMQGEGPVWMNESLRLEEGPFTPAHATAFHRGYVKVLERTAVRLETYPAAYFDNLASSSVGVRLLRLEHRRNGQSLSALLIPGGETLSFALIAKDRPHYDDALYTTLLQCIVLRAILGGYRGVRLGQTSSYSKCSVGARPRRLETFIRLRGTLRQWVLERFGSMFFPEVEPPRLHVFKDAAHETPADGMLSTTWNSRDG
jgi:hypothetical protein